MNEANIKSTTQSRKWALTINNPKQAGLDHAAIKAILMKFVPHYFCLADEIATTGTYHTHIYIYSTSPMRFSTIKKRFPIAHIEPAQGSSRENRDYICKSGKWEETEKADTSVPGTFEEWGDLPPERAEDSPEMYQLMQELREGKPTMDILDAHPKLVFKIRDIEVLRQTILAEKYSTEKRDLDVTYIYGASGTGKTWGIFARNDPRDICRITNYGGKNGVHFDAYHRQNILVFEEFHSQIPIADMLNYLDIYPLTLPARYSDRQACYTKVYITSNIPMEEQYSDIQKWQWATWQAFLRRILNVIEYLPDGTTVYHKKGGWPP